MRAVSSSSLRPEPTHRTLSTPGRAALLVMLSGTFMVVLDFFIVNVALPSIQRDLHAGAGALQWVVIGYGLTTAAALITGGRLGDSHGRRRVFMCGLALFSVASAVCGVARSAEVLVAARIAQGLAGALLQPQVIAMLGSLYSGEQRAKAFAAYGLTLGLGAACGQLVGGLLIDLDVWGLGWRNCFLINVPIGALALALSLRVLPSLPGQAGSRLDLRGAAWLALGLISLLLPLVQGRDAGWPLWSLVCLAASPLMLAMFWRQQQTLASRGGQPLVAPKLLAQPGFLLGLLVTLTFYAGNASFYFVLALYLQQGLGLAPLPSGLMFSVLAGAFFATSMASPRFAKRWGRHAISIGALVLATGHALMFCIVVAQPAWSGIGAIAAVLLVQGSGLGMVMAPLVAQVLAGMPAASAGVASGALATVQQVGNALGVALIGIVFYGAHGAVATQGSAAGFGRSLVYLFWLAIGVFILYRRFGRLAASTEDRP